MAEIIVMLMAGVVMAVVVYPLIRPPARRRTPGIPEATVDRLLADKEAIYAVLKELEFDHQIGKLTLEDYEELKRLYQARAAGVLEALDRLDAPSELDDAIEAKVAAVRARRQSAAAPTQTCIRCGTPLAADARFCHACGTPVGGRDP